jgi:multidrug efflux pump subunit AcrA (membrane-fusion protein)
MKNHIIVICLLSALAGCGKESAESAPKPVVEVKVAKAEIADLRLSVQAPATIFPREQASVASRVTARILKLNAKKGDYVKAGQPLASLENRDIIAQRDSARAAVTDAEASLQKVKSGTLPAEIERARGQVTITRAALNQAQKNYDRRKDLFDKGAIPQRDLLLSETELAQAKASYETAQRSLELLEKQSGERDIQIAQSQIDQAKARLAEINAQLEFTEIRSPFVGVITEQMMYPGDMAKPDAPIFTVMDLSTAVARAQVPEAEGGKVRQGQSCSFTPADARDASFTGRVSVINQAVDPQRRTVEVWCEIPNGGHKLRGGVFGSLSMTTGSIAQSVVAPVSAVQFAEGSKKGVVMVVDDKNIAHAIEVETGEVIEGKARIVDGLKGGETVIIEGGYNLPDGTQVRNREEKGKDEKEKDGKEKEEKEK